MDKTGLVLAFGTYLIWGLFPIYWKWLKEVQALELLAHRILWSFVFLFVFVLAARNAQDFRASIRNRKVLRTYLLAALLIGLNWLVYVWAVNSGFIVETSLGYFINPLISVALGMVFLRERLRPLQWLPVGLAAAGVAYLTFAYGRLPWIALTLAFSFGVYGLVKKVAPLGSVYGLTLETGILFLPALTYLLMQEFNGQAAFLRAGWTIDLLLVGAGLVTTVPLLMFASAARRIPLTMIGLMQYLAPTLQFLLGVLVYREPFSRNQAIGFGLVWAALLIFWLENWAAARAMRAEPIPELGEG